MKNDCYILIGLPASGKTTYVNNKFESIFEDFHYYSSDQIIENIAIREGKTYDEVFNDSIQFADKMFWYELFLAKNNKSPSIIDRTNLSKKTRKKIIDLLKDTHNFHAVVFKTPSDEEHKRRLNSRPGKTIPENVIENMKRTFEEPTLEEGFATIKYFDSEEVEYETI